MHNLKEYIDIDTFFEKCKTANMVKPTIDEDGEELPLDENSYGINAIKFELLRSCVERILNEYEDADEDKYLASTQEKTAISFSLPYNTLKHYNIIKTENDDDDNEE
jgi:hypothetical protein